MKLNNEIKKEKNVTFKSSDENVLRMYLNELKNIPLLSKEEEECIARAAANGDEEARNRLIRSNLRFVVNVAKKYQGHRIPLEDLISEGNSGLITAAQRFDVEKGYHFISYAVWWIRQSIIKAICDKSRLIRLPVNRVNELMQIEKAQKALNDKGNSESEIRKIAQLLNMEEKHIKDMIAISREAISLDTASKTGNNALHPDIFIDKNPYDVPEQLLIKKSLKEDIDALLETLDSKEAEILRYRFGLGSYEKMSLKELSNMFDLTKERIRQIESKAIKRLQHPSRKSKLESYVA
ncbi:MAG: RNA polymerase sigma factor RpoD/SigA [Treponema sp.]|nr:RNA polymerase sigma factor RpoD/SigA [Treponema sp.]